MIFKKGDKVKCIDNEGYENSLTIGKIYSVVENNNGYVIICGNDNREHHCYPSRFKLVKKNKVIKEFGIVKFMREINANK